LEKIIKSFRTEENKGLPLGNLTSQLFANVYLNRFDQFIKHEIKGRCYIRYADDFVILSEDKGWLIKQIEPIRIFLTDNLKLELHPDKLFIETVSSGVDFLGWINFPDHRVLRRATKKRMFRKLKANNYKKQSLNFYLGMLSHGNSQKIRDRIIRELS
jgi:hypothetical protein